MTPSLLPSGAWTIAALAAVARPSTSAALKMIDLNINYSPPKN
jgi:hypothetical protein